MKIFSFNTELFLPWRQDEIFSFFSDAGNLERLTPPWLNFEILTPRLCHMEVGTRIDYRLKLHGITIRWRSEITVWDPPRCFVDRQSTGPYRLWNHQHTFLKCARGTLVIDSVKYATYGGWFVRKYLVEPDLKRIFEYRCARLREIFGGN
jgi:ligand-binding SRPBCC domain-containing protein